MNALHEPLFPDRQDAGRCLGAALARAAFHGSPLVLALPRGGVPVAAEVARALRAPLDVLVVRKLGVPGHEEYAMGAIASGGIKILRKDLINSLELPRSAVEAVVARESAELARREVLYRGGRMHLPVAGRTVIVVDDGIATGSTMLAAVQLLRQEHARHIVVAVPVASPDAVQQLQTEADEVLALFQPEPFGAVGYYYQDFSQTSDAAVREILDAFANSADDPPGDPDPLRRPRDPLTLVRLEARPLTGADGDYDELLRMIDGASVVLLGEATHGTREFYQQRALITKRLIQEKGFNAVAVEADWPDAYRVNRYVHGEGHDPDAEHALQGFQRFPSWMWRNADVLDFVDWLREHNSKAASRGKQVGFFGLDLYSLHKSMDEVIRYLEKIDPDEARKAKQRYGCINRHGPDPQDYGLLVGSGLSEGCRAAVLRQLLSLQSKEVEYLKRDGAVPAEEYFFAEQNARLVANAENYYRQMFRSDVSSWNLRDEHMMETLMEVVAHCRYHNGLAKVVVWAHNSHLGDARATERARYGELNIGQLVRDAFPHQARLVGFSTYDGSVTAAAGWHLPAQRQRIRPALEQSYERLFHEVGIPSFWIDLRKESPGVEALRAPRLERAIGVVYRPETERQSHYFTARLSDQFDAIIHFDRTCAVEPSERTSTWDRDEAPETFPVGL